MIKLPFGFSLEYFTVLHPQVLPIDYPPTAIALVWGVIATWWVGLDPGHNPGRGLLCGRSSAPFG